MRIVMLSTDTRLFDEGSSKRRIASYGKIALSLYVIVVGTGSRKELTLADNVTVALSGGKTKLHAVRNAFRVLVAQVKSKPDVITSQDPMLLGLLGLVVSKLYRIPLQVQIHTDCLSNQYRAESLRRFVESMIARIVIRGASGVRVVSERIKDSVRKLTNKPIFVIPIMNETEFTTGNPRPADLLGGYSLVSVSRLTREKNIHILVQALRDVPEATLTLVGDGPLRSSIGKLAEKLGVTERLRITGWKEDVRPYLEHADAYISASRYEGYGLSLIEAANYGKPIITTDVGIVGEVLIKDRDALVVPGTREALGNAIQLLLSDAEKASSLGARARHTAQSNAIGYDTYLTRYREALLAVSSGRVE